MSSQKASIDYYDMTYPSSVDVPAPITPYLLSPGSLRETHTPEPSIFPSHIDSASSQIQK
ncbi:hypothetical protein DL93DRAFT_2160203, partial [Clavulina sp. PMI_390]